MFTTFFHTHIQVQVVVYFPTLELLKIRTIQEFSKILKNSWRILQELLGRRNRKLPKFIARKETTRIPTKN